MRHVEDEYASHSGKRLSSQEKQQERHLAKLKLYHNKETYFRSRVAAEPEEADRLMVEATSWARLAEVRRLVQAKHADTAAFLDHISRK